MANQLHEVHILVGCADARDLNQVQMNAMREMIQQYKEQKGIDVELHVIRSAGSFITEDVYTDIKRTIKDNQTDTAYLYKKTKYYVHITTHGELDEHSEKEYCSHIYNMAIKEGSPLNCGMLKATNVGMEIEDLIIKEKLEVTLHDSTLVVDQDFKIRTLMKEVYAHDGYLAGDWLKSIDYLRTHPRTQKATLEHLISGDAMLNVLGIEVTAGIQDYALQSLIRLDDGKPEVPFWDDFQMLVRKKVKEDGSQLGTSLMNAKQDPYAGLLCMSDPRRSSRELAAKHYLTEKGVDTNKLYLPNTIFCMAGTSFDIPLAPFGPYVIGGFYYAVKHLELTDWICLGGDAAQTNRIITKVKNDPIMNLVVKKFRVNLLPVINEELLAKYQVQESI